jgi:hypothetical protein
LSHTQRRAVVGFRVSWWKKDIAGLQEAYKELKRPKVGRMARLRGTVEPIADSPRQPTEAEHAELAERLAEMPAKEGASVE